MTEELFVVELRELPLAALDRAQVHAQTLMRELALVHTADEQGVAPARLLWLSQHLDQRYAGFNAEPRETLQNAIEADHPQLDMRFEVPEHAATAAEELGSALDEVDDYCRNGDLLTLVTPPDVLAFRRWFLAEFVAQIRHRSAPTPWSQASNGDEQTNGSHDAAVGQSATSVADDAGTIIIHNELDLEGAARVRGEFTHVLESGVRHLTVDLAACTFIDSVGISLLLTTRERLQDSGGTIVVTNATGTIGRALQTTGVYDVLTTGG